MPLPVFTDPMLNTQLFTQGFVKIPFWTKEVTRCVKEEYANRFSAAHASNKKFHTTYETVNDSLIKEVNTFLQPFFLAQVSNLFSNMTPISAAYLAKEPGEGSESPIHQDAQFVNEPDYYSVSIWVALQDCDEINSTLQFVPGSHKIFTGIRYLPYTNHHIEPHLEMLKPALVCSNIKAGEAFVFLNATLHGSLPNNSSETRLAAVMGFYQQGTSLSLYTKNEATGMVDRYRITDSDLLQINKKFIPLPENLISSHPVPAPLKNSTLRLKLYSSPPQTGLLKRLLHCLKSVF